MKLIIPRPPADQKPDVPLSVMGLSAEDRKLWWEVYRQDEADAQFAENYRRIKAIEADVKNNPNRQLRVLLVSCSGRDDKLSCAHEKARSTTVLENLTKRFENQKVKAVHVNLWDANIEHCNGCYGSEDYWCHWPCTCWPFDDGQKMYEEIAASDAIVIGSPINEAGAASRFYQWWHRLICVDRRI